MVLNKKEDLIKLLKNKWMLEIIFDFLIRMSTLHRKQHVKYLLTGLKNIQARFEVILKPFVYSDCICSVISCVLKNRHKKNTPDH